MGCRVGHVFLELAFGITSIFHSSPSYGLTGLWDGALDTGIFVLLVVSKNWDSYCS